MLILATATYIGAWSYVSILKYLSLHAYVYDAGLFMQALFDSYTVHWTLTSFFQAFTLSGLDFVLSPLALPQSYPVLFVAQTVAVGLCGPIVYLIAVRLWLSRTVSLLLALSYLLFFTLSGANYFDLHDATFVPLFVLLGYYLYVRDSKLLSCVSFGVAALGDYPISLLVALFAGSVLVDRLRTSHWSVSIAIRSAEAKVFVPVAVFSVGWFLTRYIYIYASTGHTLPTTIHVAGYHITGATPLDILITILLLTAPFLFFPLLSLRALPPLLLYAALAASSGLPQYAFPYGVTSFYLYLWTPFLFIGFLDVATAGGPTLPLLRRLVSRISETRRRRGGRPVGSSIRQRQIHPNLALSRGTLRRAAMLVLTAVCVLALFLEPFGPLNGAIRGTAFFPIGQLQVNETEYRDVERLMSTIPVGDAHVVIQNGLPEFFPRAFPGLESNPLQTPGVLLVPGVSGGLPYNLTYQASDGAWKPIRIDYVVADPLQSTYYETDPSPYNLSMYALARELYASGSFGVRTEIDGMFVLEANYTGAPTVYSPFHDGFGPKTLESHLPYSSGAISITNLSTGRGQFRPLWRTPTMPLSPGTYEINVTVGSRWVTAANSTVEIILSLSGSTLSNATTYSLEPDAIGEAPGWSVLHYFVSVSGFWEAFAVFSQMSPRQQWAGQLLIRAVSASQVGPPVRGDRWAASAGVLTSPYVVNSIIEVDNLSAGPEEYVPLWKTPELTLAPALYEVNVSARYLPPVTNSSAFTLVVSSAGSTLQNSTYMVYSPASFAGEIRTWATLHIYIHVSQWTREFEVFAQLSATESWTGTLEFEGVTVAPVGP